MKALAGNAAKLWRRGKLRACHPEADDATLDEWTAAIGMPGDVLYTSLSTSSPRVPKLPLDMEVKVCEGEVDACATILGYHLHACDFAPETHLQAGREAGLTRGWTAVQQSFALSGRNSGSKKVCNIVVSVLKAGMPVGLLAMSSYSAARFCLVQAIHVAPSARGPWRHFQVFGATPRASGGSKGACGRLLFEACSARPECPR